jgi:hypothetical protein
MSNLSSREIAESEYEKTIQDVWLAAPPLGGTVTLKDGRVVPTWEVHFIRNIIENRIRTSKAAA